MVHNAPFPFTFPLPALAAILALLPLAMTTSLAAGSGPKTQSVFFPAPVVQTLRANVAKDPGAREQAQRFLELARPWREQSDDELWSAMFGATLERSWMVWSNGFCPACKQDVPMYAWKIDALREPWKVTCPHCAQKFPKNDFAQFHRSGLDAHGVFAHALADRSLLFNTEHPAADDPLHRFGVDDGTGYFDGANRWRFTGAYLIYGQWKQNVLNGIRTLATAYVLSGDPVYARKAAILLDRVADLYPTFDFATQGLSYEQSNPTTGTGLVSVWHDACNETRGLALAYDMIFPALAADRELSGFLAAKARRHQLANPKRTFADIQRNIEDRILREVLHHPAKIFSNFPNTEITQIIHQAILGWPANRDEVTASLQAMLEKATAVDGLSGEKGLGGYSAIGPRVVAEALALFDRLDPELLPTLVHRVPDLKQMYRFHADAWFLESYYPKVGDTGPGFGQKDPLYAGVNFNRNQLAPAQTGLPFVSTFTLFGRLHGITGDPLYVKLLYRANGGTVEGLPHDLLAPDPAQFQASVAAVIRQHGTALDAGSVNKEKWCLGMLRSGQGAHARGVWLDYDIGGNHGRADAMNIGLYAKGLELLSGLGYPPVHFGGWYSPRALWYRMTAAHNTVVVDGKNQMLRGGGPETEPLLVQLNPQKGLVRGRTTAWAVGEQVKLIRASGPDLVQTTAMRQYERSLLLVDVSAEDCYLLDVFRVAGGRDHAKFLHGYFGQATATGLALEPLPDFGADTQMRHFRGGTPEPGWQVDWKIADRYHYLPEGTAVHLRHTDLTRHAQAALAETWLVYPDAGQGRETWVPSLMVRRQAEAAPLTSTFVSVLEPYTGQSNLKHITRLPLQTEAGADAGDTQVAVAVEQANGKTDLLVVAAPGNNANAAGRRLRQADWDLVTDAGFCLIRRDQAGQIEHIFLSQGKYLQCGGVVLEFAKDSELFEAAIQDGKLVILRGDARDIKAMAL
jgi:hypothetical protein